MKLEIDMLCDTTDEMIHILDKIKKDILRGVTCVNSTYYNFDINEKISKPKQKQNDINTYMELENGSKH